jgi:hypothetical protein
MHYIIKHVGRQLSDFQFQICRDRNAAAHSWAWAAEQEPCMRYCRLTNYFCLHMGAAGSSPPGVSPSSCTAHVSWHQAHEHEASNTHSHIHSCVAEVSTLQWLSGRSSVAPHGVTCTMAAILGTNLHASMCIYCLAGLGVWSHYFLFPFLLAKHAAECAMWTGLLEPLKFSQNLIITRLQYWPHCYRKNNTLI